MATNGNLDGLIIQIMANINAPGASTAQLRELVFKLPTAVQNERNTTKDEIHGLNAELAQLRPAHATLQNTIQVLRQNTTRPAAPVNFGDHAELTSAKHEVQRLKTENGSLKKDLGQMKNEAELLAELLKQKSKNGSLVSQISKLKGDKARAVAESTRLRAVNTGLTAEKLNQTVRSKATLTEEKSREHTRTKLPSELDLLRGQRQGEDAVVDSTVKHGFRFDFGTSYMENV